MLSPRELNTIVWQPNGVVPTHVSNVIRRGYVVLDEGHKIRNPDAEERLAWAREAEAGVTATCAAICFAVALALNRTLVLPRMLCACVYAQWPFVGAGNLNCQPLHMQGLFPRLYECPPSYWLSLPRLLRSDVPLREPGFLEHKEAAPLVWESGLLA